MVRRTHFGDEVCTSSFVFRLPDGSPLDVTLRVGKPYQSTVGEWACPIELKGFEDRYADIRGADSLQALCLAISFVRRRLEDFVTVQAPEKLDHLDQLQKGIDMKFFV